MKKIVFILGLLVLMLSGCDSLTADDIDFERCEVIHEERFDSDNSEFVLKETIFYDYADECKYCCFSWKDGNGYTDITDIWETECIDKSAYAEWEKDGVSVYFKTDRDGEQEKHFLEYPDMKPVQQSMTVEINNEEKPEITAVEVSGKCAGKIENKVNVYDVYDINFYVNQTVGLVGVPVKVEFDSNVVENVEIKFHYDDTKFGSMPERNLICLYNNDTGMAIDEIEIVNHDVHENTVTVKADKEGNYLLDDAYIWRKTWGDSTSSYEYQEETTEPYEWTISFEEFADVQWAEENAPDFHVQTASQLAGVVLYSENCSSDEVISITLELPVEIPNGINWRSMGRRDKGCKNFIIDGQNYSIDNMVIDESDREEVGFIGYAENLQVKRLQFFGAEVTGKDYVGVLAGKCDEISLLDDVWAEGTINTDGENCGCVVGQKGCAYKGGHNDVSCNGNKLPAFSFWKLEREEIALELSVKNGMLVRTERAGYNNLALYLKSDEQYIIYDAINDSTSIDMSELEKFEEVLGDSFEISIIDFDTALKEYELVSNTINYKS